jgi:hypothetical protein
MRINGQSKNGWIHSYHIVNVIDTLIFRPESGSSKPPTGVGIAIADDTDAVSAWQ